MPALLHLQVNLSDSNIPQEHEFQLWLDILLSREKRPLEVNILIVDTEEGAQYNQTYRHKVGPTNVLSFPFEQPEGLDLPILGDIVLCAPVILSEANAQKKSLKAHYAHLTIHGCLHLLGYDHIKEEDANQMEALEVNIMNKLEYPNPYENGETVDHA